MPPALRLISVKPFAMFFACLCLQTCSAAGVPPAHQARDFLAGLFDPELRLLPEYPGAKTYWLYHDNYLAAKALASSHPKLAAQITAALRERGVTNSGKIEIVHGEARSPPKYKPSLAKDAKMISVMPVELSLVLILPVHQ